MKSKTVVSFLLLLTLVFESICAQAKLSATEQKIREIIRRQHEDQIAYLGRVVDIPSSTLNLDGVRKVGEMFRTSFEALGFDARFVPLPKETQRAGHLVADHKGKPGLTRLLLIGHLDTVVEPQGPTWSRLDTIARGVGAVDIKGGDVVILYALKALKEAGAFDDLNITIVFTGDEEHAGDPISVSRKDLIDAANRSDIALGYEGGNRSDGTIARRGASGWRVEAKGHQAHSADIFDPEVGYGAIYELARILNAFREQLVGEQYLTFNVGTVVGGTDVVYDTVAIKGSTASKLNIVPKLAIAHGDLRFISEEQKNRTRAKMHEIVAKHLPGTDASITFVDEYPAMSPTPGNAKILAFFDTASRALGYGRIVALDPGRRGAGDISFVAPYIDGLDGLGALGGGSHAPDEYVDLKALLMQTERTAILLNRLGRLPSTSFVRKTSN